MPGLSRGLLCWVLLLAGCNQILGIEESVVEGEGVLGASCETAEQCELGQQCVAGRCQSPSDLDASMAPPLADGQVIAPDGSTPIDTGLGPVDMMQDASPDAMVSCEEATVYLDQDMDGFGVDESAMSGCPEGMFVASGGDCDDGNNAVYPEAEEACNGADDDCDQSTDEGCDCGADATVPCGEPDGMGGILTVGACEAGEQQCVDNQWSACEGETTPQDESCNGSDDDCDGTVDEGVNMTFYQDLDGDTYGRDDETMVGCEAPEGYAARGGDCNDGNDAIHPGATEECNGEDDDCDNTADMGCPCEADTEQPCGARDGNGNLISTGDCMPGAQACENGMFGACIGAITPVPETCNNEDDDCDGIVDNGVTLRCWDDGDGDGYAAADAAATDSCDEVCPAGTTSTDPSGANNADCADDEVNIYPGRAEACDDIDQDCDTQVDEGALVTFYPDADGDGFGVVDEGVAQCTAPTGHVMDPGDCRDDNDQIFPGQTEHCDGIDEDCDTRTDEGLTCSCQNGDTRECGPPAPGGGINTTGRCEAGTQTCTGGVWGADCDGALYPMTESCNEVDDNCNGMVDESPRVNCWNDGDSDGYALASAAAMSVCGSCGNQQTAQQPTPGNADCDDALAAVRPQATETCNQRDDDCDNSTDEGVRRTFYRDVDGDNYGDTAQPMMACTAPTGYVAQSGDCNDNLNTVYPGRAERCNNIDDNCNGQIDDGISCQCLDGQTRTCGPNTTVGACETDTQTCTDGVWPTACPGAVYPTDEVCNGDDDDCNGNVDEGTLRNCWQDPDRDTYAVATATNNPVCASQQCPTGYTTRQPNVGARDCAENNANVYPQAPEMCNAGDDDCDGNTDEGVGTTYYRDLDTDTFGNPSSTRVACTQPSGYVGNNRDCNDNNAAINPNASEICNGVDDNCAGGIDEGNPGGGASCTVGVGSCRATGTRQCTGGSLVCSASPGNPSAETCDGNDNDCDTRTDEGNPEGGCADSDILRTCTNGSLSSESCRDAGQTCWQNMCDGVCYVDDRQCVPGQRAFEICGLNGRWGNQIACGGATTGESWEVCRSGGCTDSVANLVGYDGSTGSGWSDQPLEANEWRVVRIPIDRAVKVFSMNVILSGVQTSARVKLTLWNETTGPINVQPGQELVSSASVTAVNGLNSINIPARTMLEAGTYWLGVNLSIAASGRFRGGTSVPSSSLHARSGDDYFTSAPSPFPTVNPSIGQWGMYLRAKDLL